MKKQINPTIKAHLIRGAFYLLLLLAVCAIPFALAQIPQCGTGKHGQQAKCATNMYTRRSPIVLMEQFPTSRCRTFLKPGSRSYPRHSGSKSDALQAYLSGPEQAQAPWFFPNHQPVPA